MPKYVDGFIELGQTFVDHYKQRSKENKNIYFEIQDHDDEKEQELDLIEKIS